MKYAITLSGGRLSPHFGHCEQFALFEVDEQQKRIINREIKDSPEQGCGMLPAWLGEQGVSLVIAGGMGVRPQEIFRQNGIRVVLGTLESDPEQAVLNYLEGNLATGDNFCDGDHEGSCHAG